MIVSCAWDIAMRLSHQLMLKVDSFLTVATMLSYSLPSYGRGVTGKFTTTHQGIVMIVKMCSDHTSPCVHFFYLILIHGNTVQMYASLIYKYYASIPYSAKFWQGKFWRILTLQIFDGKYFDGWSLPFAIHL